MLKFALIAACAVQLAAAADPKISSTADGSLIAEDKSGKVCLFLDFVKWSTKPHHLHTRARARPVYYEDRGLLAKTKLASARFCQSQSAVTSPRAGHVCVWAFGASKEG